MPYDNKPAAHRISPMAALWLFGLLIGVIVGASLGFRLASPVVAVSQQGVAD